MSKNLLKSEPPLHSCVHLKKKKVRFYGDFFLGTQVMSSTLLFLDLSTLFKIKVLD